MDNSTFQLQFGKTTSSMLHDAITIAKQLPGYAVLGEAKHPIHSVTILISELFENSNTWDQLQNLVQISSGWKSTLLQLAGTQVGQYEIQNRVGPIRTCYKLRSESQLGDDYCRGKETPVADSIHFGCRHLNSVSRTLDKWETGLQWFHFGTLSANREVFTVDKAKITETLNQQSKNSPCRFCPAFNFERVAKDVDSLPNEILIDDKCKFEIKLSEVNPSIALGIDLKDSLLDFESIDNLSTGFDSTNQTVSGRCVPTTRYSDIAGMNNVISQMRDVIELPLTSPDYFTSVGLTPQRGVLLYGPPGNGKTLLVKAVATESNAHLEIINGPEILSKWIGQSEENLRRIFDRARKFQPSIVLIDEIDSIASTRDGMEFHHQVQLISQLLVLLDGIESRGNVFVIGTTNRLEAVDPAIRRSGRFDYHIKVPMPSKDGREAILAVHLNRLRNNGDIDLRTFANSTEGWSGAELASLCREAGLLAVKKAMRDCISPQLTSITQIDFSEAYTSILSKRNFNIESSPAT